MKIFDEEFMYSAATKIFDTATNTLDMIDKKLKEDNQQKDIKNNKNTEKVDDNGCEKQNKPFSSEYIEQIINGTKETYEKVKKANETRKKVSSTVNDVREKSKQAFSLASEKINEFEKNIKEQMEQSSDIAETKYEENFTEVNNSEEIKNNSVKKELSTDERLNNMKLEILNNIHEIIKSDDKDFKVKLDAEFEKLDLIKKIEKLKTFYQYEENEKVKKL